MKKNENKTEKTENEETKNDKIENDKTETEKTERYIPNSIECLILTLNSYCCKKSSASNKDTYSLLIPN